jgi:hypothetical protein
MPQFFLSKHYKYGFLPLATAAAAMLLSVSSRATEVNASNFFRAKAAEAPRAIQARGLERIGGLAMADLLAEIGQVQWRVNRLPIFLAGSGGSRTFAISLLGESGVIVNQLSLPLLHPGELAPICLHETFMARGFADEDYPLSTIVTWFSFPDEVRGNERDAIDTALLNVLSANMRRSQPGRGLASSPAYSSSDVEGLSRDPPRADAGPGASTRRYLRAQGGATSIGSGGDPAALFAKLELLLFIARYRSTFNSLAPRAAGLSSATLADRVARLKLEPWGAYQNGNPNDVALRLSDGVVIYRSTLWLVEAGRAAVIRALIPIVGDWP